MKGEREKERKRERGKERLRSKQQCGRMKEKMIRTRRKEGREKRITRLGSWLRFPDARITVTQRFLIAWPIFHDHNF